MNKFLNDSRYIVIEGAIGGMIIGSILIYILKQLNWII